MSKQNTLPQTDEHSLKPFNRFDRNTAYLSFPGRVSGELSDEVRKGLELLGSIRHPLISVIGSEKVQSGDALFDSCLDMSSRIGRMGCGIITSGEPGVMLAANTSAFQAHVPSVAVGALFLPGRQVLESVYTHKQLCRFLFVQRFLITIKSEALVVFPGGTATLNAIFEQLMLMRRKIVDRVPIICVGRDFWGGLVGWFQSRDFTENGKVGNDVTEYFQVVEQAEDVTFIIEKMLSHWGHR